MKALATPLLQHYLLQNSHEIHVGLISANETVTASPVESPSFQYNHTLFELARIGLAFTKGPVLPFKCLRERRLGAKLSQPTETNEEAKEQILWGQTPWKMYISPGSDDPDSLKQRITNNLTKSCCLEGETLTWCILQAYIDRGLSSTCRIGFIAPEFIRCLVELSNSATRELESPDMILASEGLLLPVSNSFHWALLHIDFINSVSTIFDSSPHRISVDIFDLSTFLKRRLIEVYSLPPVLDPRVGTCLKQSDTFNCRVFCINYVTCILDGGNPSLLTLNANQVREELLFKACRRIGSSPEIPQSDCGSDSSSYL
jgi:hypothetical protein